MCCVGDAMVIQSFASHFYLMYAIAIGGVWLIPPQFEQASRNLLGLGRDCSEKL